jgi:nucleoside-diphosphate-sugar epimerase
VRVFVAGGSGVLGTRVVPLLVADGHEVAATTRSPEKVDALRRLGATPVVCDIFEADELREAVASFRPDAVMHQVTDLPDDEADLASRRAGNARIRREGTTNLVAAACAAGASRFLVQSVAWDAGGDSAAAVRELERATLRVGGVVLRYGRFYGPGTYHAEPPPSPRIHIDEAARRTAGALDAPTGILELVEEEDPGSA